MRHAAAATLLFLLSAAPSRAAVPRPSELSVEELAGQVFLIAIDTTIAVAREADIRAGRVGGAMLRWDRFDADQARAFSVRMREWSSSSPHAIPLWLSTDYEGGATFTQRRYGGAPYPGNMALGAAGSEKYSRESARDIGAELRSLGLQITYAPDVDVNSNPANPVIGLRAFGDDPEKVAKLGVAALRGYRDAGVLAMPKHFPGHGDTSEDSHTGLPVSTKTMTQLEATELVPFRAAFLDGAEAVMPAHIVEQSLGSGALQPVTLSTAAIGGFLRGTLGFHGLIFSDDLNMGAITKIYGSSEAAVLALLAGNDVLEVGIGDYPGAYAGVVAAVNAGRLPRARLEDAVGRILAAKKRLGMFKTYEAPRPLDAKTVARHRALAREIAEASVTLIRNNGVLPLRLKPDDVLGVVLVHSARFPDETANFVAELTKRHARIELVDLPVMFPKPDAVDKALARLSSATAVIAGTYQFGAPLPATTVSLLQRLAAGRAPLVAVSMMNPYDLANSTGAAAAVATYGMTNSALEAAARLIFGEIPSKGRLPVSVPGAAKRGDGVVTR
jgi:beta-N-acetylhexosaminidase